MKKILRVLCAAVISMLGLSWSTGTAMAQIPDAPATWSIVSSYTIPGKASGLAWDGTYIYFGIYGTAGNTIYKFNPTTGNSAQQCTGPFSDAFGLTCKSPNLVTINQPSNSSQPAEALEFTMAGTQVSVITLPTHYMSGIAYDNGSYWVSAYYPDPGTVYHINSAGTVLSQFVPPNNQPWDICMQGSDLWIADYWGNMLYKVTTTGTVIESHASEIAAPAGIVFDGTYLWYCAGPLGSSSTLYKINLNGSGTPVISLPVNSHNFGTVTVGSSPVWNCQVNNTGTAPLTITSVGFVSGQPVSTSFSVPAVVPAGGSVTIPFTYNPLVPGVLNTTADINSTDPVHPTMTVTFTGNAVISGPHISIAENNHNWGDRRKGAWSRWYLPDLPVPMFISSSMPASSFRLRSNPCRQSIWASGSIQQPEQPTMAHSALPATTRRRIPSLSIFRALVSIRFTPWELPCGTISSPPDSTTVRKASVPSRISLATG